MSRALLKGIHRVTAQPFLPKSPKITSVLRLSSLPMNTFPKKTGLDYILFRRESDPVAVSLRAGRPARPVPTRNSSRGGDGLEQEEIIKCDPNRADGKQRFNHRDARLPVPTPGARSLK